MRKTTLQSTASTLLELSMRADLYRYFEEQGTYTTGKIYYMRKDCYGYSYDKGILEQVSYNLQHSRTGIVASAYLYLLRQ